MTRARQLLVPIRRHLALLLGLAGYAALLLVAGTVAALAPVAAGVSLGGTAIAITAEVLHHAR